MKWPLVSIAGGPNGDGTYWLAFDRLDNTHHYSTRAFRRIARRRYLQVTKIVYSDPGWRCEELRSIVGWMASRPSPTGWVGAPYG